MTAKTEFDQLIEAVERQPGSRAFALLAERYLSMGKVQEALDVCEAGFSINPAYERGAIAYLNALREQKDTQKAKTIYTRAVSEHPKSSTLRIEWAKVLLDAGREYEARLRTREAVELDPMNRDARALLATLGGTPPPSTRMTGKIELIRKPHHVQKNDDENSSVQEYSKSPSTLGYGEKPSVASLNPISTPKIDHQFDFTPLPEIEKEREEEAPALDALADFFSSASTTTELSETQPTESAKEPAYMRDLSSKKNKTKLGPPPPPLPSAKAPKPASKHQEQPVQAKELFPAEATIKDPPKHDFDTEAPPHITTNEASPAIEKQSAPLSIESAHSGIAEQITDRVSPLNMSDMQADNKATLWLVILGVLLTISAGAAAYVIFFTKDASVNQKLVNNNIDHSLKATSLPPAIASDDHHAIVKSWKKECKKGKKLSDTHKKSECALIAAYLYQRHKGLNKKTVSRSIKQAPPNTTQTKIARVLVALAEDDFKQAKSALTDLGENSFSIYLNAIFHLKQGNHEDAFKSFSKLAKNKDLYVAAIIDSAIFFRQNGDIEQSVTLIKKGLKNFPKHLGLQLEDNLLDKIKAKENKYRFNKKNFKKSQKAVYLLAKAYSAAHSSNYPRAIKLALLAAADSSSHRMDALSAAIRWQSFSKGDLSKAYALIKKERIKKNLSLAFILQAAEIALRLGQTEDAITFIERSGKAQHEDLSKKQIILKIRLAEKMGTPQQLQDLCPPTLGREKEIITHCADTYLSLNDLNNAKRFIDKVEKHPYFSYLSARYLFKNKKIKAAKKTLELALKLPPQENSFFNGMVHYTHGLINESEGHLSKALEAHKKANRLSARASFSMLAIANIYASTDKQKAQKIMSKIEGRKIHAPQLAITIAKIWSKLGQAKDANNALSLIKNSYLQDISILKIKAEIAIAAKDYTRAEEAYAQWIKQDPNALVAKLGLAKVASLAGKTDLAAKYFKSAAKAKPNDPRVKEELGFAYLELGELKRGVVTIESAIQHYEEQGNYKKVVALRMKTGVILRSSKIGWVRKKAKEMLFLVSKTSRAPAEAFYELGLTHLVFEDSSRAIWCFKEAIKRKSDYVDAYLQLGLVCSKKRKWKTLAQRNLKEFLKLAPEHEKAAMVKTILSKL